MTSPASLDRSRLDAAIASAWEREILPTITEYIAIPCKSPAFDRDWATSGHLERAVDLVAGWCRAHGPADLSVEVVRLEGRTPVVLMELAATPGCEGLRPVLLYGHLDKQPEMTGWREGLGPWTPVREGDRLYGRGGGDDGYAAFASVLALRELRAGGGAHARAVVLIEACEESGSYDLPHYVEHLAPRLGDVELVVCLDSGAGDYERLWGTTSLRGLVNGDLTVELLANGVHSGDASGVVPDSFRVARALLSRLEDEGTGRIVDAFHVEIPAERREQAAAAGAILGDGVAGKFPFLPGVQPVPGDPAHHVLARTWEPALSIVGAGGLPALADAGNVSRPLTALKLSLRVPPTLDAVAATARVKALLERDPPYGARVRFEAEQSASGWNAPALAPWLGASLERASQETFGAPAAYLGEGGSIPFMGMLGERFPDAQFLITGVLGPESNAHGPNEFLHLPTAERVTACVARVLDDHARRA